MQLRKRRLKSGEANVLVAPEKPNNRKKIKKALDYVPDKENFSCDIEGCCMNFSTKHDLCLHKRDVCPEKGCGKKFFSHKYLLQHQKVHCDDRPLKCPWKGYKMRFKWAWARTEHIRVHTGERPYSCREPGCALTFHSFSDFSQHTRMTGLSQGKFTKEEDLFGVKGPGNSAASDDRRIIQDDQLTNLSSSWKNKDWPGSIQGNALGDMY
ncbi:Lysine-specific demethylase REF6 [Dendrobium catenatum]|uniref:Lysine-specific demethylase REF6 n=1 Tax=Dendrobium catenatum TaxID=906689 RepID=A0A2I0VW16_9ASPA|nr:Lysine-specific demethylase REF6 [Dendrobium catenatum]